LGADLVDFPESAASNFSFMNDVILIISDAPMFRFHMMMVLVMVVKEFE
jgi:hypothetical protein